MSETPDDPAALAALIPESLLETPLAPPELAAAKLQEGADLLSAVGFKLGASLFLHHFCLGAWYVTLGSYVSSNSGESGLGIFAAGFVGMAYGAGPLAAMISPFISGLLADHYFAAERMIALLSVGCALAMAGAIGATTQTGFFLALFAYFLFFHPSCSLAISMSLHHLRRPERDFAVVRAWGTAGWIAAGLFVGWLWPLVTGKSIESTDVPMRICVVVSLVNAVFSLWMPHTPPINHPRHVSSEAASLRGQFPDLFRDRRFLALMFLGIVAHIPSQFYYAYSNVYFNWTGMKEAAAKMTLGQGVEMIFMLLLPAVLTRISVKAAVCTGLAVWALRFLMLSAAAEPTAAWRDFLLYASIMTHGLAFTMVTISLQLDVDRSAGRGRRSTAQGLFSAAVQGFGCFAGAELAGLAGARWLPPEVATALPAGWTSLWLVPAVGSVAILALTFLVLPRPAAASD